MTFVLQLHFVKMKLNLKQKKDILRFDYLLNASPSHRTAIPSKIHLLVFIPFFKKRFARIFIAIRR